jgi:hypothetical protein
MIFISPAPRFGHRCMSMSITRLARRQLFRVYPSTRVENRLVRVFVGFVVSLMGHKLRRPTFPPWRLVQQRQIQEPCRGAVVGRLDDVRQEPAVRVTVTVSLVSTSEINSKSRLSAWTHGALIMVRSAINEPARSSLRPEPDRVRSAQPRLKPSNPPPPH